ncbi:hypothetical protein Ancab_022710 [Ancistrocladus abbreviatus]
MQKFKIGSKVEILRKKNVPPGMWRSAEIVEENGDYCIVRYNCGLGVGGEGTFQRVPWELIRPCPPAMKCIVSWEVGDVVEVLDVGHWKVAVIAKVLEGGYYHIRLIGSLDEFAVQKSSIRFRRVWSENKWFVIGKDSRTGKHTGKRVMSEMPGWTIEQTEDNFQVFPSGISKRALPDLDACTANFSKKRAVEKRGQSGRILPGCSFLFLKKVDAAAYSQENRDGNLVHPSNVDAITNNDLYKGKQVGALFYNRISELNDSISTVSSVGSCGAISCDL